MPVIKSKNSLEKRVKELREQVKQLKQREHDRNKLMNDLLKIIDKYKEEHKDATNK